MDNVQKYTNFINIPSSQIFGQRSIIKQTREQKEINTYKQREKKKTRKLDDDNSINLIIIIIAHEISK
jgi:hypothetical protein